MPEALEFITLGSSDTPKNTPEPHIAACEFASNASAFVSENIDGCGIILAVCSRQPQPARAS